MTCARCQQPLTGGIDTFGPHREPKCCTCWFRFYVGDPFDHGYSFTARQLVAKAEEWNKAHPIGTIVRYGNGKRKYKTATYSSARPTTYGNVEVDLGAGRDISIDLIEEVTQ